MIADHAAVSDRVSTRTVSNCLLLSWHKDYLFTHRTIDVNQLPVFCGALGDVVSWDGCLTDGNVRMVFMAFWIVLTLFPL